MTPSIERIEAIPVSIPFTHYGPPTGFGGTVWTHANFLLIRVTASDGVIGWGEAFGFNVIPATRKALEDIVAPLAIGKPCGAIAGVMAGLEKPLHIFGRSGPVQYALSGLDIALWDMAGKRAGMSVAGMLGRGERTQIPVYNSLLRIGDAKVLQQVCETVLTEGFNAVKLHETDPALAVAARQALGENTDLMLDVNCAWDFQAARHAARHLQAAKLTWLEEPIWPPEDLRSMNRLAQEGIDLAAGENVANPVSFHGLADAPGLSYLQPSVTKVGGISAFVEVAHLTKLLGKQLAPHSPYFGPGYLATLQMAAAFPQIRWVEMFGMKLDKPIFGGAELPDKNGFVNLPDGPGLGMDPDPDVLATFSCI